MSKDEDFIAQLRCGHLDEVDRGQKIIQPACPCWHVALGLEEIRGPDSRTRPLLCPADTELVQMPLIRGLVP